MEDGLEPGFTLYALAPGDPRELLDEESAAFLERIGCNLVELGDEHDAVYREWFAARDCGVALVRPDFYVFGTAGDAAETRALVRRAKDVLTNQARFEEGLAA